ncbi:MAG: hypothetical protein HQ510_12165 [Candidatus Marinimicrobia bacterium]|nr:hypothetical protein [Candidatus Neomarinimicrobiota bacterium]
MKYRIHTGLICMIILSTAFTQSESPKSNTESWYTYWGLGMASIDYPTELQSLMDELKAMDGVSSSTICIDMLGFYWHIDPRTIGGVVINGTGDRVLQNDDWIQFNQYIYGGSLIKYVNDRFGSGPFIRTDIGLAKAVMQSSDGSTVTSKAGVGVLVGGGWSFDRGKTRILLNLNYAFRNIEDEKYGTLSFSVGGLF